MREPVLESLLGLTLDEHACVGQLALQVGVELLDIVVAFGCEGLDVEAAAAAVAA